MKLKATDTIHISSVSSDNILTGQEFEVSDADGKVLVERGLATRVGRAAKAEGAPPSNRAQRRALRNQSQGRAPANK